MNSQLDLHLETFASKEEFSESSDFHEEEDVLPLLQRLRGPWDTTIWKCQFWLRKFVKAKSFKDTTYLAFCLLPIAIMLSGHIGTLLGFSVSSIYLLVLYLNPDGVPDHENAATVTKKRQQVHSCRQEVSRLLGLIGAPPLLWENLDMKLLTKTIITDSATISVVEFLEAQVQFLLTVDQAYCNIQICTSLHLGLGPQSQCVERVERAAIAKAFRNRRKESDREGASLIVDDNMPPPEPQRGMNKSILALASIRKHLAKSMVAQSESLHQVWKDVYNDFERGKSESSPVADKLDMPDVVDLYWIKSSRHKLASLLSRMLDSFCTLEALHTLSGSLDSRSRLDESMWNVRNAKEHLSSNLLLEKTAVVKSLHDPSDKLILSLIQYRERLDALCGTIWACQQYTDAAPSEYDQDFARREWWSRVKQLGATCRALENEITQTYFSVTGEEDEENNDSDSKASQLGYLKTVETGDYEDGHGNPDFPTNRKEDTKPTKTMVFKGQGSLEERSKNVLVERASKRSSGDGNEMLSLPPRDTISEKLLVEELQNRIDTICAPEEDEEEEDFEQEKLARAAREPTNSHFLGASGSLLGELKLSLPATEQNEEEILED